MTKKQIRENFRNVVFQRDNYRCVMCGYQSNKEQQAEFNDINCHHILDRHLFLNGGYVAENGITLCDAPTGCHWKAEHWHATGTPYPGYSAEELYNKIGSSLDKAIEADEQNIHS